MSYGEHILTTGAGWVGEFELTLGRFFYERDFAGRAPILDLAPGRCWFTKQDSDVIHAVDLAPDIVEHYAREGLKITQGDAYDIPHPDSTFQAVFCCWLFEHLLEPDRAMREVRRVLQDGGMCFLVVPSEHQLGRGFWDDYTHVRPFTMASLTQLARINEFVEPRCEHLPFTRLIGRLSPVLGPAGTYRCLRFSDRFLRRFGLVNRDMLTLACYKPALTGAP